MTAPKPFVFVLMPFSPDFDDVYKLGIKPACESAGAYAERVDEQIFEGQILDRIYNQIARADLIVSDMSGRNPNVFYETGYAHALGKTVILLTQNKDDIPFDLNQFPHIVHEGRINDLIPELEKRVRWALDSPGRRGVIPSNLHVYHDRKLLNEESTIVINEKVALPGINLTFDIHNAEETTQETAYFEYAVISPAKFIKSTARNKQKDPTYFKVFSLPDERNLHLCQEKFHILPQSWHKLYFWLLKDDHQVKDMEDGEETELTLRLYTKHGVRDIPFLVRYVIEK